jgi:hypothetical protein
MFVASPCLKRRYKLYFHYLSYKDRERSFSALQRVGGIKLSDKPEKEKTETGAQSQAEHRDKKENEENNNISSSLPLACVLVWLSVLYSTNSP